MMKRLFACLAVLSLLAGGYFAYRHYYPYGTSSGIAKYLPSHALAVYTNGMLTDYRKKKNGAPVARWIADAYGFYCKRGDCALSRAVFTSFSALSRRVDAVHVSLHPVHKDRLDLLFFVKAPDGALEAFTRDLARVLPAKGCATAARNLKGRVIHEFRRAKDESPLGTERFSYFLADGYLIGSFSPFLVEEVVRTLDGQPSLFHARPWGSRVA